MNFEIYPINTYSNAKLDPKGIKPMIKPMTGNLETIVNELIHSNKGYNELLKIDHKYKFFMDLDKVTEANIITEVQEELCILLELNDINEVKYTESFKPNVEFKNQITGDIQFINQYSYHVVVPSYNATLADIKKIVKHVKQNPYIAEYIDDSIYTNNRWFRLPKQTNKDKQYSHKIINGSMEDFILSYIPLTSQSIQYNDQPINNKKQHKKRIVNNKNPIKAKSFVVDDTKLTEWLNMLPETYLDDYQHWSIITNILKGLNKFDVWDNWSKQSDKYNGYKNRNIWRSCKKIVYDINYLMNILGLDRIAVFKSYEAITKDVCNKKTINHLRVVDKSMKDSETFTYNDFCSNDNIIIKSCCGTGKTYGTSIHMNKFLLANPNYKVVCITDRISLGQQIMTSFNAQNISLVNYKSEAYDANKNFLCCINSLHKIAHLEDEDFQEMIVYIDEINTFLKNYTHNETLDSHLNVIHTTLIRIIKHAHKIIFTDARINDGVFELLQGRNMNKTLFIENLYKKFQNVPAIKTNDQIHMLEIMKKDIANNEYFTFASDSCKIVEEMYALITNGLDKELIKEKYIIITSNHPYEITNASEQFNNKYVFYSPSIVTGVDITLKDNQDVFIFIKGDTLDAESSYQQATRTRNIKSLFYCCNTREREENYNTLEDVKQTYLNYIKDDEKLTQLCTSRTENDEEYKLVKNKFFNLFCYNEYNQDIFNTNRRKHFEIILTDEGFILDTIQDNNKADAEEREQDFDNLRVELTNQLFNEYIVDEDKTNIKYADLNKIIEYLRLPIEKDILMKFREFIVDQYKRAEHFRIIALFKSDDYINGKIEEQKAISYDIKKLSDKYRKIKLFREIQAENGYSLLDLNTVIDPTKEFKVNYDWSYIKKQFNTTKEQPKTRDEFKTLYISFLKHITSAEIVESKQITKAYKKQRVYKFNDPFIQLNIELNNYSNPKYHNYDEQFEQLLNIKIIYDLPIQFNDDQTNELDKNIFD